MAWNETISASPKLNAWEKIKKTAGDAYNAVTDIGEKILPFKVQGTEERSLKKQLLDRYPTTPAFAKYVNDQPVQPGLDFLKTSSGERAGGWNTQPPTKYNMPEALGSAVADTINNVGVKLDNPAVTKVTDYLVNKFYNTADREVASRKGKIKITKGNGTPNTLAHETLHGWYKQKMENQGIDANQKQVSIVPFSTKFNSTWEKLKKDPRIGQILNDIDNGPLASKLYTDSNKDPYSLANERYAYLGANSNIGTIMAMSPELNSLYGDVMNANTRAVPTTPNNPLANNPFNPKPQERQIDKALMKKVTDELMQKLVKKNKIK